MKNDNQFIGSLTKVERANQLIEELEKEFIAFNQNDPVDSKIVINNGKPEIEVHWKGLPLKVGSILGDTIHNLRSSLDLLAVELVEINGQNNKNVYFPFASSESELEKMIISKNFHKAGIEAVEILKQTKPFNGGNILLRALHDLDIDDKHKRLLDTEKEIGINFEFTYNIDKPMEHKLSYDCNAINHFFENESHLSGKPVIETLRNIKKEILSIITSFSNLKKNNIIS